MSHANLILSTCGTSLLTYQSDSQRVNKSSNFKTIEMVPPEDKEWLSEQLALKRETLQTCESSVAATMVAELNAIMKIYGGRTNRNTDHHILLCTDTWLGEEIANAEAEWLRCFCGSVEVKRQKDLQTSDLIAFQLALSELVKWSAETLPAYKQRGYRIILNLTGGFKSVQGFMQTLAMFYADEVVYIFQEANTLMRIPRLPITLDTTDTVRENLRTFRRLSLGLAADESETNAIPETLLLPIDQRYALSPWGEIVWEDAKKQLYREALCQSPTEALVYGEKFYSSVSELSGDRLEMVNKKNDDLARYLETGKHLASLDFKELKVNPLPPSTHGIDAWADQDAKRIFGH